jgi:hypothetical protein
MRVPPAPELLDIWEQAQHQPLPTRMLCLLAAAMPETHGAELGALPIGRRNALLLDLRERAFGSGLAFVAECPCCGSDLELAFAVTDIRVAAPDDAELCVEAEGYRVQFRLPASDDLLAILREHPQRAPAALLQRCLLDLRTPDGECGDAAALPPSIVAAIDARMATADPQADIRFETACPSCAHAWHPTFDVANFLWQEIHAWAKEALRNVHSLARAYGWRETDVLALSPTRRRIYLELARS